MDELNDRDNSMLITDQAKEDYFPDATGMHLAVTDLMVVAMIWPARAPGPKMSSMM